MDSDKILNPNTGRYVNKTSVLGKKILAGKTPKKRSKSCNDTQIKNPSTGRCVKKTGKIGRSLSNTPVVSSNGSSSSGTPIPSNSSSRLALPVVASSYVPPPAPPELPTGRNNKGKLNALSDLFGINEEEKAVNTLGAMMKRKLDQRLYNQAANVNKAVTTIQGALKRRLQKREVANQKMASRQLQSMVRQKIQRNIAVPLIKDRRVLLDSKAAAIQEMDRKALETTNKLKGLIAANKQDNAATKIQNAIRGKIARNMAAAEVIPNQQRITNRKNARYYKTASNIAGVAIPAAIGAGAGMAGVVPISTTLAAYGANAGMAGLGGLGGRLVYPVLKKKEGGYKNTAKLLGTAAGGLALGTAMSAML